MAEVWILNKCTHSARACVRARAYPCVCVCVCTQLNTSYNQVKANKNLIREKIFKKVCSYIWPLFVSMNILLLVWRHTKMCNLTHYWMWPMDPSDNFWCFAYCNEVTVDVCNWYGEPEDCILNSNVTQKINIIVTIICDEFFFILKLFEWVVLRRMSLSYGPCKWLSFVVDRASLYNLVDKANLVHNLFLVYLFLVYLSISSCFRWLCAHRQEKQLECVPDSHPHRITSTKCRINTVVSPDDGHVVTRNM